MVLFNGNDKLFDLVEANHNLLPVFSRFGIRPGFKDSTVNEICAGKGINRDFFLALVNTYNNPDYFPEEELLAFSPVLIIDYLRKTHEYYLEYFLPRLETLLDKMAGGPSGNNKELAMIRTFYEQYKRELLLHIRDEEENVFPAVIAFVESREDGELTKKAISFEKEHSNVEMKLSDLKHLTVKYVKPSYDDNDFFGFLTALYRFEKDILDHARIEDKILIQQIKGFASMPK